VLPTCLFKKTRGRRPLVVLEELKLLTVGFVVGMVSVWPARENGAIRETT
jgi:hypothetical protein